MKYPPLVTVIIIFLNEERFLREAIDSVIEQTYDHWELLLVDDGSSDGSTAIARRYSEGYPSNIYYLEHQGHANRGMSASRNLGVQNARGSYIAFLDGDDVWLPFKLEEQVEILQAHPEAAMVYGPLRRWFSWNNNPTDLPREDLFGAGRKGVHPYSDQVVHPPTLVTMFLADNYFIPGGILIKRQAIENIGGFEEIFRGMYEDTVMLTKICLKFSVFVSSRMWYMYRMHPESCTFVTWRQGQSDPALAFYLNWLEGYLIQEGIQDPKIKQALRKAQFRCRHMAWYRLTDLKYILWLLKNLLKAAGRVLLPAPARRWLRTLIDRYKVRRLIPKI